MPKIGAGRRWLFCAVSDGISGYQFNSLACGNILRILLVQDIVSYSRVKREEDIERLKKSLRKKWKRKARVLQYLRAVNGEFLRNYLDFYGNLA